MQESTMNRQQEFNTANPDAMDYEATHSAPGSSTVRGCGTAEIDIDSANTMDAGEGKGSLKGVSSADASRGEPCLAMTNNLGEPSMKMDGMAEKTPLATEPRLNMTREPHKDVLLGIQRKVYADNLSFGTPRMTPTQLAEKNENFLGNCVYFHMDKPVHRKECTGDYIIVYTRPLKSSTGELDDPHTKVYQLASADRIIGVRGEAFHTPPAYHPDTPQNWGQARISVNNQKLQLFFGELVTHNNEKTLVKCSSTAEPSNSEPADFLEHIIHKGVNQSRVETSFGLKTTGSELFGGKMYYWGFYFIEIKLPFFNTKTGEDDEQLIIGAKLPYTNHLRDISNTELLKQEVYFPAKEDSYTFVNIEPKFKTKLRALYQGSGKENGEGSYKGKGKEEDVDMESGEAWSEAKGKKGRKFVWRPIPAEEERPNLQVAVDEDGDSYIFGRE